MRNKINTLLSKINNKDGDFTQINNLFDAGIIDSFGIISLITSLEAEFSIQIPHEELNMENFGNVSSIINLVDKLQNNHSEII